MSKTNEKSNRTENKVIKDNHTYTKNDNNRSLVNSYQRRTVYKGAPKLNHHKGPKSSKARSSKKAALPITILKRDPSGIVATKAFNSASESICSGGFIPVDAIVIGNPHKNIDSISLPIKEPASSEINSCKNTDNNNKQNCISENRISFFESITTKQTSNPQGSLLDYEIHEEYLNKNCNLEVNP